jgi:Beta-ketoacyl synthase, N-terminal domain
MTMSLPEPAGHADGTAAQSLAAELTVQRPAVAGHLHNRPSMFADPVGWLVAEVVQAQLATVRAADPEHTGLVVVSEIATAETMGRLAVTARAGRVSPIRFAGANPGVVAGLACIRSGLRGPALLLTMAPAAGLPVAAMMARAWLRDGAATGVLVVEHELSADAHRLRCVLHSEQAA